MTATTTASGPTSTDPSFAPGISPDASVDPSARIDVTARVEAGAVIGPDVIVGPHCAVGEGCELRVRAILWRNTVLGPGNVVHPYAVLGGDPQDKAYSEDAPGWLFVGEKNIFREGVTISRGTDGDDPTRIGSRNFFMAQAHAAHNVQIGDDCVFPNTTMIAGHVRIGSKCIFSGGVGIHQFTVIGDGVMVRGLVPVNMHIPPYVMVIGPNRIGGLNVVGLRRMGHDAEARRDAKRVHAAIFREREARPFNEVLDALEAEQSWSGPAREMIDFVRMAIALPAPRNKGICPGRSKATDSIK